MSTETHSKLKQKSKMRILWHSVAPFIRSGYGHVTNQIVPRLADHGFDIWISAYYGVEPGGVCQYRVPVLPSKEGPFGVYSAAKFARQFNMDASVLFCYSDDTEILTREGWKKHAELTMDTEFATLNENEVLEYQKPTKLFSSPYSGRMYNLEMKNISLLVTPNHKMYVKKRNWSKFRLEKVENIDGKRVEYKKNAKWDGIEPSDYSISVNGVVRHVPMKLWLEFLGYYISEGCTQNDTVKITQANKDSKEVMVNCVDLLCKCIGGKYSVTKDGVIFTSKDVAAYCRALGTSSETKHLPSFVFSLSSRYLEILWDAMILGDGWLSSNGVTEAYCSSSKLLIDQLQEVLLKMGSAGDIRINFAGGEKEIRGKKCICNPNWYITRLQRLTPRTHPEYKRSRYTEEWVPYKGVVWCPTVPNHVVYVRRNGKACWSGNTDWWAFCLSEDTEILTKDGWKTYDKVSEDEVVATFNKDSKIIEFQQINCKTVNDSFDSILQLKSKQLDFLLTGNHSLVYRTGKAHKNNGVWLKKNIENFIGFSTENYVPVSGQFAKNYDRGMSKELAWLIGFVIAKGSFRDYDLRIYQSTKNIDKCNKLREYLKIVGCEFKESIDDRKRDVYGYKTEPCIQFQIPTEFTKQLKIWFKDIKTKLPTDEVMFCSDREYECIMEGIVDGDGWIEKSGAKQIKTSSEALKDFIQIFAIYHKNRCIVNKRNYNDSYELTLTNKNYASFKGKYNVAKIPYKGFTWCVNVPNGNIIIRRNGKHCIVGNSDFPKMLPRPMLYGPMDMCGYSEEILNFTKMYTKIISLCKWQQNYLKSEGIESDMIYHGVDISKFKPLNKSECKKKFNIPDDVFVFGTVSANSDKESRKGGTYAIKAMKHFLDSNPDVDRKKVVWMWHTQSNDPRGMPLNSIVHKFGLDDVVKFMDPSQADLMIPEEDLIALMNTFDVHLLPSRREGFGMCVEKSTLIETKHGPVPISEILPGDDVLTMEGEFKRVIAMKNRETDGYIIKVQGLPEIKVSKEHPFLVCKDGRLKKNKTLDWVKAEGIKKGDYLVVPVPIIEDSKQKIDLVKYGQFEFDDDKVWTEHSYSTSKGYYAQTRELGLSKRNAETVLQHIRNDTSSSNESVMSNISKVVESNVKLPEFLKYSRYREVDREFLELIGWYIAEGSIGNAVEFNMGINDKQYFNIEKLRELGSVTELSKDDSWRVCLSGVWKEFFKQFGMGAENKHIAEDFYLKDMSLHIVRGMMLGDGGSVNGSITYTTSSRTLAYQLRQILIGAHIYPSIRQDKRTSCYTVVVNGKQAVELAELLSLKEWFKPKKTLTNRKGKAVIDIGKYLLVPVRSVVRTDEKMEMTDIQVEDSNTFVGGGVLLHNTILETQSCGIPNISHNFSSMTELIEGHGWLCKSLGSGLNLETTPVNAETAVPDVYDLTDKIAEAYFKEDLRKKYGKESREFAIKFNWDDLITNQWVPLLNNLLETKSVNDRRLF